MDDAGAQNHTRPCVFSSPRGPGMRNLATLLTITMVAACAAERPVEITLEPAAEIASPAGPASGEPFLAVAPDGDLLMSWIQRVDSAHELRFARYEDGAWSAPRTIARSSLFFVNWADFPSIIGLPDSRLAAHWLGRSGPGRYSYDVWVAFSSDDGTTWSEPERPHNDGTESEHGFVSLFPWQNQLGAIWLDGRKYAEAEQNPEALREMTVQFALLDGKTRATESLVDGRACDCCQTDVAIAESGPVLVYRDRSNDEIRDIAVSRFIDNTWTQPVPVYNDGWNINACPVNGPAIAARGPNVAVAWFTGAQDSARVNLAFSNDAAASFQPPIRIDSGDPIGRVDVMLLDDETAVVSWLERQDNTTRILARTARPGQSAGPIASIGDSSAERASGFPRLAQSGDRVVFAWTQPGTASSPATIRIVSTRLARN